MIFKKYKIHLNFITIYRHLPKRIAKQGTLQSVKTKKE